MGNVIIQPEDKRFFVQDPDSSFSPRRNQAIIQETIEETTKFFQDINGVMTNTLRDRMDMVASYGKYRLNSGGQKVFSNYIGKDLERKIVGENIARRARIMSSLLK